MTIIKRTDPFTNPPPKRTILDDFAYEGEVGLQAGRLWTFGKSSAVYLAKPGGTSNPFNNPKFVEIYQNVDQIVSSQFQITAETAPETLQVVVEIMKAHLSNEEATDYLKSLATLLGKTITFKESDSSYTKLYKIIVQVVAQFTGLDQVPAPLQKIIDQAKIDGKPMNRVIDEASYLSIVESVGELLKLKPLFWFVKNLGLSESFLQNLALSLKEEGQAWNLGVLFSSHQLKSNILQLQQGLEEVLAAELSPMEVARIDGQIFAPKKMIEGWTNADVIQQLKELHKEPQMANWAKVKDLFPGHVQEKITIIDFGIQLLGAKNEHVIGQVQETIQSLIDFCSNFQKEFEFKRLHLLLTAYFEKEEVKSITDRLSQIYWSSIKEGTIFEQTKTLFIVNSESELDLLKEALGKKNIYILGPIQEPIKPRGFLWKIENGQRTCGYFLGSIHLCPPVIVDKINSATLQAFQECDTLGVEMDITNKETTDQLTTVELISKIFDAIKDPEVQKVALVDLKIQPEDPDVNEAVIRYRLFPKGIQLGLDFAFISKAMERQLPIINLDNVGLMNQALDQFNQIAIPKNPIQKWESLKNFFDGVNQISQDFESGWMNKPEKMDHGMIEPRDAYMAESMHQTFLRGKTLFSVAGGFHHGIVSHLREKGYKVTRIISEEPL